MTEECGNPLCLERLGILCRALDDYDNRRNTLRGRFLLWLLKVLT